MLNTGYAFYHKITYSDLCNFAKTANKLGAKEIISFGGYKPILVYYSRMHVNFDSKKKQVKRIKELTSKGKSSYIIGYLSDIKSNKPIIKNNESLFKNLKIIKSGERYFLGRL